MKTQRIKGVLRSAALGLCSVGLALSGAISSQASEQASSPATETYGSGKSYKTTIERQSEGELSAEDLHQASLLSSQLLKHLNAAAVDCIDGKGDSAKPEIEKAQSLAGIVRQLLPTTTVTTIVKDAQGKDQQLVRQQFVTTGASRGDQVSILKGVAVNDQVVTAGQLKLHNGSIVKIDNAVQPTDNPAPVPRDH